MSHSKKNKNAKDAGTSTTSKSAAVDTKSKYRNTTVSDTIPDDSGRRDGPGGN